MYLTSMSVFLSNSAIISLWNLLNFRWKGGGTREKSKKKKYLEGRSMLCDSWSARCQQQTGKKLSVSNREMESESGLQCVGAGLWGREPNLRLCLWMSQKQSVGNPTDFSAFYPALSLERGCRGVPVAKAMLKSPRGVRTTELEDPVTEQTPTLSHAQHPH